MPPADDGTFDGLRWKRYGTGAPILLLHGFGATSYAWRFLIAPLSRRYTVWTVDLKGHGESTAPRDDYYAVSDHALLMQRFIERFDLKDLTVVGNSLGGGVALLLAMRLESSGRIRAFISIDGIAYPQTIPWAIRILRMPLLGPFIVRSMTPRFAVKAMFEMIVYDKKDIALDAIDAYAQNLRTADGRYAMLRTAQQLVPPDLDSTLAGIPRIRFPTFILWGRNDRIVPLSVGERLSREIRGAKLVIFEKCGHIPQEEKPQETLIQIETFLQKNGPGSVSRPAA